MSDKYSKLKVKELQEILQKNGLPHTGKKEELIERLIKHDEEKKALELDSLDAEFGNLEEFDETKINLDEITETDLKSSTDKEKTDTTSSTENKDNDNTTSTTVNTNDATDKEVSKEGSGFKYKPIVFNKTSNDSNEKATATDAEKKMERAKRFGIDVNESTKQELRAKRFGTSKPAASNDNNNNNNNRDNNRNYQYGNKKQQVNRNRQQKPQAASKGVDPEVLKKRAERFGLGKPASTTKLSPEDEEKKRKRAERFGEANKKSKN